MKVIHFEYALTKLIDWYLTNNNRTIIQFNQNNDFSKLKVLKLHFFICAINSKSNSLLELFNSFYAMPYGHVEGDLYDAINKDGLTRFYFSQNSIVIREDYIDTLNNSFQEIENNDYKKEIDFAIESLRKENPELIMYSALKLVDLSHLWTSWKITFHIARSKNKFSEKIPADIIQSESKFFSISY